LLCQLRPQLPEALDLALGVGTSVVGMEVSNLLVSATNDLIGIGEFSRRSWLSPKALRLYERLGLLVPAQVGEENGYRSYRESQLETARLIAMLRRLDMPLSGVSKVVAAPEKDAAALLREYWDDVERRAASQRELARHLYIQLSGEEGSYQMYEVKEREVPEHVVLTEQRHVTADELSAWIEAAGHRLLRTAEEHGGAVGPMFVVYHGEVSQDSDGPVEVCVPIPQNGSRDVAARVEPAHREAYTRITKAQVGFPQILSAYDVVTAWIRSRGLTIDDCAPREIYFTDWDAAGPDDEVCDIAYPLT
jgi:DNA-binding transcriptional MerR regulator